MSRKGKAPIQLPKGIETQISKESISIKGPKGTIVQKIGPEVSIELKDNVLHVSLNEKYADKSNFHGLYRSLIANMVVGTTTGFEKKLQMIGVGYRAAVQGNVLDLQLGFSHPTKIPIPAGMQVKVDKNTLIIINGINKQEVGQFAATVRSMRPPEPYQGKGIRYEDEYVRKKAGKAAAKK
jgi:large subunit ribosomal protein L6